MRKDLDSRKDYPYKDLHKWLCYGKSDGALNCWEPLEYEHILRMG